MADLTADEKLEIQRKIEKFISAGNPVSFLRGLGILDHLDRIDFEKTRGIFATIEENEEEILSLLDDGGFELKERSQEI